MNWSRVKTILIIIFLIINLFLIYNIISRDSNIKISEKEITEIKSFLLKNDIELMFELSNSYEKVMRLNILNETYNSEQSAMKILNTEFFDKKESIQDGEVYQVKDKSLYVYNNGMVNYVCSNNYEMLKYNIDEFEQAIYNFLLNYMDIKNYELDYKIDQNGKKEIGLKYIYDKKYEIFNNYLTATLLENGELSIKHGFITPLEYDNKFKQVSYIDSIINLTNLLKEGEKTQLKDISLGYYVDIVKNDAIMKTGEVNPVWKITTNKEVLYFDSYTGEQINIFPT